MAVLGIQNSTNGWPEIYQICGVLVLVSYAEQKSSRDTKFISWRWKDLPRVSYTQDSPLPNLLCD